jgi:hypothetical protein
MSRLDDGIEKFRVFGVFALLLYVLVFLPLWGIGVFEWKLFHSPARLVNKQVELCVADRNTEMQLFEPRYTMQQIFGSNESEVMKKIIVNEIKEGLKISAAGFKALSFNERERLIETWDNRPYWWEEIPEFTEGMSEEEKQTFREFRELEIERRSETADIYLNMVNEEIAENEKINEANQRIAEANELAREKDALWNGLSVELRTETCLPKISEQMKALNIFSRVDRHIEQFEKNLSLIQVTR